MEKSGATVIADDKLKTITKDSEKEQYTVVTKKGFSKECQMVGGFFGLIPNVDFLLKSGLEIDRGILVNETLQTSYEDVYASGDCAQIYNPAIRNYWVSIGWPNAVKLGEIAAHNLLGTADKVKMPPQNIFSCDEVEVKTAWWQQLGT